MDSSSEKDTQVEIGCSSVLEVGDKLQDEASLHGKKNNGRSVLSMSNAADTTRHTPVVTTGLSVPTSQDQAEITSVVVTGTSGHTLVPPDSLSVPAQSLKAKANALLRTDHSVEMTGDLASQIGRKDWSGVESDAVMKEEREVPGGVSQGGLGTNGTRSQHLVQASSSLIVTDSSIGRHFLGYVRVE